MERHHINNTICTNIFQTSSSEQADSFSCYSACFFFFFSPSLPFPIDPEYKKFLESYSADDEKLTSTPETLLEEIEARNKELIGMEIYVL